MSNSTGQYYDRLDIKTLINLLVNPDSAPEVHRGAFDALTKLSPDDRREQIAIVMRAMLRYPGRYNPALMIDAIEIYATDPHPDATTFMLDLLPEILALAMSKPDAVPRDVREYFYQALITRQREDDLRVWSEWLPRVDGKTLVAAMLDPVAGPLEAIEPVTLIDRLPEPERTRALMTVIAGLAGRRGVADRIRSIARLLVASHDEAQFQRGVEALIERWEKASKAKRADYLANLQIALSMFDTRPRSAMERMRGKRPWVAD